MPQLDFLTVMHEPSQMSTMEHLLELFKQKYGCEVQGNFVSWGSLWRETTNVGIYKRGSDFAETGSTWLDGLVAMHCLRPFTPQEIARLGGPEAFLPSSWSTVTIGESDQIWGIPVRTDVRVLWYWEDMLESAGLDPQQAFASFDEFPRTFEALQAILPNPWTTITTASDANSLQALASWVWQAGGDFVSKNGRKVLFTEPAARLGMRAYFDLHRYMDRTTPAINGNDVGRLFAERKICAMIGGPWLPVDLAARNVPTGRVKATLIPGPSFVGGTVMVIYAHTRHEKQALDFLEFINTPDIQLQYGKIVGLLPTLHKSWQQPPLSTDPLYQALYKTLSRGRSYPSVPLWGVVEQKLLGAVGDVWNSLFRQENPDLDAILDENFVPLAHRLELSLNS